MCTFISNALLSSYGCIRLGKFRKHFSLRNVARGVHSGCTMMVRKNLLCAGLRRKKNVRNSTTNASKKLAMSESEESKLIRNIGIMAHVDAGKTTTTERMLYYSGYTRHMGEVHHGDTVMDYMDQERERGITITSAAISFVWNKHRINLIDTPGHVDFTMEVERAICALDGAVAVLDASAGVEAQTRTVWNQATRYGVPRIVFLNKMDKPFANTEMCIKSLVSKLKVRPLVLQLPIYHKSQFVGVVDLITMQRCVWNPSSDGHSFDAHSVHQDVDKSVVFNEAVLARNKLIEEVADLDDTIAGLVLQTENYDLVSAAQLHDALRRITLKQLGFPVICGSSFRNTGVQLLMDAIVRYLPSPSEVKCRNVEYYNGQLCALVFKIVYEKQRGFLTFLRVYTGTLKQGQRIYNINEDCSEKIGRLYVAYANDFKEVQSAGAGAIIVATGLKQTVTGDTIVETVGIAKEAQKQWSKSSESCDEAYPLLGGLKVPEPVFFCAIEPASLAHQKTLDFALECLKREDPSLKVENDEDSGQTILSGMGELHLEIIHDRIQKEYKVEAELGPLQVAYKETIETAAQETTILEKIVGDSKNRIVITLSVQPHKSSSSKITLMHSKSNQENLQQIKRIHMQAIEKGIAMSFQHGPLLGYPVVQAQVGLHWLEVKPGSTPVMVGAAARQCVAAALKATSVCLLEPYMHLEVTTEPQHLHSVLGDLAQRRGQILEVDALHDQKIVRALIPLAELMRYSTSLRTITSGLATFSMEFASYQNMTLHEQEKAIARVTGFAV